MAVRGARGVVRVSCECKCKRPGNGLALCGAGWWLSPAAARAGAGVTGPPTPDGVVGYGLVEV